jgi:hypothetical protein
MALQFAIIYILVVGLGILSAYQGGMFNEFVEEVHNIGMQASTTWGQVLTSRRSLES